jgi:hypothetical protein
MFSKKKTFFLPLRVVEKDDLRSVGCGVQVVPRFCFPLGVLEGDIPQVEPSTGQSEPRGPCGARHLRIGKQTMPRTTRPAALRALPMPTHDLLRVGDRVTFVSLRANTEKRGVTVRGGVLAPGRPAVCVVEDGNGHIRNRVWGIWQVRLRTVRRDGVLLACAPCVPVGLESGYAPPAQAPRVQVVKHPVRPAPAPPPTKRVEEEDPEVVAHLARMAADTATRREVAAQIARAMLAQAEAEVAHRRAAATARATRIEAAAEEMERAFLTRQAAFRAALPPADKARLERRDRTHRRTLPVETT